MRAWTQDRSGASHDLDAPSSCALAVTNAWLERRGWCHPSTGLGVTALGERRSERSTFDGFRVTPDRGAPVEVWIDRRKQVIARTILQLPEDREVESYSDWRLVNGVTIPFVRSVDYPEDESKEVWVTTLASGSTVASPSTDYASPAPPNDVAMAAGVAASSVRLELIRDKPRISVRLNGRGPFIYVLDTGGHFIATPGNSGTCCGTARYRCDERTRSRDGDSKCGPRASRESSNRQRDHARSGREGDSVRVGAAEPRSASRSHRLAGPGDVRALCRDPESGALDRNVRPTATSGTAERRTVSASCSMRTRRWLTARSTDIPASA